MLVWIFLSHLKTFLGLNINTFPPPKIKALTHWWRATRRMVIYSAAHRAPWFGWAAEGSLRSELTASALINNPGDANCMWRSGAFSSPPHRDFNKQNESADESSCGKITAYYICTCGNNLRCTDANELRVQMSLLISEEAECRNARAACK